MAARRLSEAGPAAVPEVLRMLSEASGFAIALREAGLGPDTAGAGKPDEHVLRVPLREGQRLAGVLELTPAPPADSPWAAGSPGLSLFADMLAMSFMVGFMALTAATVSRAVPKREGWDA